MALATEMLTEFELVFEDFSAELDALLEMANSSAQLTAKARIAASNAATLLLAATFEEFIRQQVKAAFRAKVARATSMADFPSKITHTVWRRSLEMLARRPFEEVISNSKEIDSQLSSIVAFSLRREITPAVGDTLAHNDSNMRTSQMNGLFNAIGILSVTSKTCENQSVIDYLGCDSPGKANTEFEAKVESFFRRRNDIAHAIQLNSSSGPIELAADIALFRTFGKALVEVMITA